jgi:hypothetical protein
MHFLQNGPQIEKLLLAPILISDQKSPSHLSKFQTANLSVSCSGWSLPSQSRKSPSQEGRSMRRFIFLTIGLLLASSTGCRFLDPNSPLNPNRGSFSDEFTANNEGRAATALEHEDMEGADPFLLSPKAQAIQRHLGVD